MNTMIACHYDSQGTPAYNLLYNSTGLPMFSRGLTLNELFEHTRRTGGTTGLARLDQRLERAHAKGLSSQSLSLGQFLQAKSLAFNAPSDFDRFVDKFLTIPPDFKQLCRSKPRASVSRF